jgi:hypothetical protein
MIYTEAARLVMGGIDLDPASCEIANALVGAKMYYTISDDGLSKDWYGNVWLNPPYGRVAGKSNQDVWSKKLISEFESGHINQGMLLVNAVTDRSWFKALWQFPICFVYQRIRFVSPIIAIENSRPNHGSCIVYLGHNKDSFEYNFNKFGKVVM